MSCSLSSRYATRLRFYQSFIAPAHPPKTYNTCNQATLTQDGNLAIQTKYLATLFDDYGRPTKTGYWTGTPPSTISPTALSITIATELTKNFYDGSDGATQ